MVPDSMGVDCGHYKWAQTLAHVEVTVRVPPNIPSHQVRREYDHLRGACAHEGPATVKDRLFLPAALNHIHMRMDALTQPSNIVSSRLCAIPHHGMANDIQNTTSHDNCYFQQVAGAHARR